MHTITDGDVALEKREGARVLRIVVTAPTRLPDMRLADADDLIRSFVV